MKIYDAKKKDKDRECQEGKTTEGCGRSGRLGTKEAEDHNGSHDKDDKENSVGREGDGTKDEKDSSDSDGDRYEEDGCRG
jgi:hypothetical protein